MRKPQLRGTKGHMGSQQMVKDEDQDPGPLLCIPSTPQYCVSFPVLFILHALPIGTMSKKAIICDCQSGAAAPWKEVSSHWAPNCMCEMTSVGLCLCHAADLLPSTTHQRLPLSLR